MLWEEWTKTRINKEELTYIYKQTPKTPEEKDIVGISIPCKNNNFINYFRIRSETKISEIGVINIVKTKPSKLRRGVVGSSNVNDNYTYLDLINQPMIDEDGIVSQQNLNTDNDNSNRVRNLTLESNIVDVKVDDVEKPYKKRRNIMDDLNKNKPLSFPIISMNNYKDIYSYIHEYEFVCLDVDKTRINMFDFMYKCYLMNVIPIIISLTQDTNMKYKVPYLLFRYYDTHDIQREVRLYKDILKTKHYDFQQILVQHSNIFQRSLYFQKTFMYHTLEDCKNIILSCKKPTNFMIEFLYFLHKNNTNNELYRLFVKMDDVPMFKTQCMKYLKNIAVFREIKNKQSIVLQDNTVNSLMVQSQTNASQNKKALQELLSMMENDNSSTKSILFEESVPSLFTNKITYLFQDGNNDLKKHILDTYIYTNPLIQAYGSYIQSMTSLKQTQFVGMNLYYSTRFNSTKLNTFTFINEVYYILALHAIVKKIDTVNMRITNRQRKIHTIHIVVVCPKQDQQIVSSVIERIKEAYSTKYKIEYSSIDTHFRSFLMDENSGTLENTNFELVKDILFNNSLNDIDYCMLLSKFPYLIATNTLFSLLSMYMSSTNKNNIIIPKKWLNEPISNHSFTHPLIHLYDSV